MRKQILVALALTASTISPAHASSAASGLVQGFLTLDNGIVLVYTNGTRTTLPACSNSSYPNRWAINGATAAGQAVLSVLLTARAMRDPVALVGTGTCSIQYDAESIYIANVNNVQ